MTNASLKANLRRAERRRVLRAFGLVAPLLVFLLFTFLLPIGGMLVRSVEDTELAEVWPRTASAIKPWDGRDLPDEAVFQALAADLKESRAQGTVATAARRLNYDINGLRTLVMSTARRVPDAQAVASVGKAMIALDARWGERATWAAIRRASGPVTGFFLLRAVDLQRDADGDIVATPPDEAIYRTILLRTFGVALLVTVLCLALGYPVAYLLATRPPRVSNLLMILVLLPFWTSLLVRTAA
ncbi:MAG TPA: ABC transporter permease, partial [Azospirillaceae bacterium]|nr:ABC transporter permease [Azospirillaceae bacterium]